MPKRQTEQLAVRAAVDFDAFYARRRMLDATAETLRDLIVVISADGKGVVMRMQDLREATRKAAAARTRKKRTRLSRGEKRHAKRMATVASVYTIAPWPRLPEEIVRELHPVREVSSARPKPVRKRVWASLEQPATHVIEVRQSLARNAQPSGAQAIRQMLKQRGLEPLPAVRTIYRILQRHQPEEKSSPTWHCQ